MNPVSKEIVIKCYRELLRREPDASGLKTYSSLISSNKCDEQKLRDILMNSDEYMNLRIDYTIGDMKISHTHTCSDIRVENIRHLYSWISFNYDKIHADGKYFFIIDNHHLKMKVIDTFIETMGDFINFDNQQIYATGRRILRYSRDFYKDPKDSFHLGAGLEQEPFVVISRYNEDVSWTKSLYNAVIYNKGEENLQASIPILNIQNVGREGHTFLHHIIENYDILHNYTVFTQANPFEHSPDFMKLIKESYHLFDDYQALTWRWKDNDPTIDWLTSKNGQGIPPLDSRKMTTFFHINNCKIHYEILDRNFNCVCPVVWEDGGFNTHLIPRTRQRLSIPDDISLLEYIYERVGIETPCPSHFPFNFSASFGVRRENILKHRRQIYKNLMEFLLEHPDHGYILERLWAVLFF